MYFCLKMPNTGYVLKGNELNLFSSEGGKIFSGMKIFLKKQLNIYCSNTHIHMHKHTYYFFFYIDFFFFLCWFSECCDDHDDPFGKRLYWILLQSEQGFIDFT